MLIKLNPPILATVTDIAVSELSINAEKDYFQVKWCNLLMHNSPDEGFSILAM